MKRFRMSLVFKICNLLSVNLTICLIYLILLTIAKSLCLMLDRCIECFYDFNIYRVDLFFNGLYYIHPFLLLLKHKFLHYPVHQYYLLFFNFGAKFVCQFVFKSILVGYQKRFWFFINKSQIILKDFEIILEYLHIKNIVQDRDHDQEQLIFNFF